MASEMLHVTGSGHNALGLSVSGRGHAAGFFHSGSNAGFDCLLIGFPETGRGAVIMTNANGSFALINELVDSLRAEYNWPGGEGGPSSRLYW